MGGLGQSWTMGEGCDWWRAEVAGEEGLSGRSDLGREEIIKVLQRMVTAKWLLKAQLFI